MASTDTVLVDYRKIDAIELFQLLAQGFRIEGAFSFLKRIFILFITKILIPPQLFPNIVSHDGFKIILPRTFSAPFIKTVAYVTSKQLVRALSVQDALNAVFPGTARQSKRSGVVSFLERAFGMKYCVAQPGGNLRFVEDNLVMNGTDRL